MSTAATKRVEMYRLLRSYGEWLLADRAMYLSPQGVEEILARCERAQLSAEGTGRSRDELLARAIIEQLTGTQRAPSRNRQLPAIAIPLVAKFDELLPVAPHPTPPEDIPRARNESAALAVRVQKVLVVAALLFAVLLAPDILQRVVAPTLAGERTQLNLVVAPGYERATIVVSIENVEPMWSGPPRLIQRGTLSVSPRGAVSEVSVIRGVDRCRTSVVADPDLLNCGYLLGFYEARSGKRVTRFPDVNGYFITRFRISEWGGVEGVGAIQPRITYIFKPSRDETLLTASSGSVGGTGTTTMEWTRSATPPSVITALPDDLAQNSTIWAFEGIVIALLLGLFTNGLPGVIENRGPAEGIGGLRAGGGAALAMGFSAVLASLVDPFMPDFAVGTDFYGMVALSTFNVAVPSVLLVVYLVRQVGVRNNAGWSDLWRVELPRLRYFVLGIALGGGAYLLAALFTASFTSAALGIRSAVTICSISVVAVNVCGWMRRYLGFVGSAIITVSMVHARFLLDLPGSVLWDTSSILSVAAALIVASRTGDIGRALLVSAAIAAGGIGLLR